ncbi:MAG: dipeptidase PepE [Thermomicrobiales bacterium]|nr:dipeptidase PepE [Thermomicrobiales bacterium]
MSSHDLLLLSNSSVHGRGYLEHARASIQEFLAAGSTLAFVPFALADHDGYTGRVRAALEPLGITVTGIHTVPNSIGLLESVDCVFVGGGNSFRLLKNLHERALIEPVRAMASAGTLKYMGSSAGTNMACPSIRTTNDMPIVQPPSFESFGLIPFQINPHYLDPDPASSHMGETREKRIEQFHEENDVPVLGLREGAWLRRTGDQLTLGGSTGARLFRRGEEASEYTDGSDLSFLLDIAPQFDLNG